MVILSNHGIRKVTLSRIAAFMEHYVDNVVVTSTLAEVAKNMIVRKKKC